jgi:LPS export ABC transporter protein LptC
MTCIFLILTFAACSFDYGDDVSEDTGLPDVVMNDVEYVRIRDGNPVVRFIAEGAERYESRQTMELKNFSFEQFTTADEDVSALGRAGNASVELDSGNIHMKNGVRIEVDSEDIAIETKTLDWQDKDRQLFAGAGEPVSILRSDGTSFTGWGFSADTRRRTWSFTEGVEGTYVDDDDDDDAVGDEGEPGETLIAETPAVPDTPAASGTDRPAVQRPGTASEASGAKRPAASPPVPAPDAPQGGVTNEAVKGITK